jgi:Ran GTPase-activating protein (RanGAP) involved in mRNA processing and transport
MSVSSDSTSTDDGVSRSSKILEFCAKVRNNDPTILPEPGEPIEIGYLSTKEFMEVANALLENTNFTYLNLRNKYTNSSARAIAKYVRTSKHLQRIRWDRNVRIDGRARRQDAEILSSLLYAIQESTSLKELHMELPLNDGQYSRALELMLTHTHSLRSLRLRCPFGLEEIDTATVCSGLKNNTTLRELTLDIWRGGASPVSPLLISLCDHPHLRKLCLRGHAVELDGFETLLLSDTSKITELDIHMRSGGRPIMGFPHVLRALARRPTLTKLGLYFCPIGSDEARLLGVVLCSSPSLHTLVLTDCTLGSRMSAGLAGLAPALYRNTSIEVLDIAGNTFRDTESTEILRDILRSNKTITTLNLSSNAFGQTTGAVECIADGLGSNSTLLKIDLSHCHLGDSGISILAQTLGSRNTTLQKLTLGNNSITSTGLGVLLESMEQSSSSITDLDLQRNPIGNEGASLLARSLGNNASRNLTRLSLVQCSIGDDGFIALMSALEQNTSLLQLDLRCNRRGVSERAYLALAESLPEIKVLQRLDFNWCQGLASAMPLLLVGLRKNTSLFRIRVADCAPRFLPPTPEETARCAGGWMQEMERLGYRNRFRPLIRAPEERLPPRGVWPFAFARVATLPDVIFEVLRSKPTLVSGEDAGGKEVDKDTGVPSKRKRGKDTNMP